MNNKVPLDACEMLRGVEQSAGNRQPASGVTHISGVPRMREMPWREVALSVGKHFVWRPKQIVKNKNFFCNQ
jgi:hypothetical protein